MRPLTITRQIQIEFHRHNVGVEKAKREYSWHPFAKSCAPYCPCPMKRERKIA